MLKRREEESMASIVFDTLKFAKRAEEAGFTKKQAEFQAEEMAKIIETELATKNDLILLGNKLTIRVGIMIAAAIGIISTIIKFGH